jgi:lipopolysaccharide export LptBFGC system permease protein LptF
VFLGGLVWVQEVLAPRVALQRDDLRWSLLEKGKDRLIETMNMRDAKGRLFSAFNYNVSTKVISRLNVSFEDGFGRNVSVTGENAVWDAEAGGWLLQNGRSEVRRDTSEESEEEEAFFVETDIRPEELLAESRMPFDLSYVELLGLSERYPSSRRYRLLRHYHVTFPLSVLLLVLLSVPFVVRLEAERRTKGLGIAIAFCMGFLLLDASLRDFGGRGFIQPVLAAWLPVIVAGSLATVLFDSLES